MTPLGLLNFLVLQWFGVRLAREFAVVEGKRIYDLVDPASVGKPVVLVLRNDGLKASYRVQQWGENYRLSRYTLLRWVWPLTGWWSDYRWIARRR